jgi:formylglycine-generating enzyme required for sulfatase activity
VSKKKVSGTWSILALVASAFTASAQMASIPGATFVMGSNSGEMDEKPERKVTVSPFKIDSFEVSFAQYDSCVKSGACSPPHYEDGRCLMWGSAGLAKVRVPPKYRSPRAPVVCVSWRQARQYCGYKKKRLPTEAEWERAALADRDGKYSWGNEPPSPSRCTAPSTRHPLPGKKFSPNGFGLYDMTGNVWEWTSDWYERDYYSYDENNDPKGPQVGRYKTIRGGGWYSTPSQLRIRNRQWFPPEYGEVSVGIRCAK